MRPAAAVLLLLTSCGALDHQLKRRRVVVRGGATAAARPTKRKIVAALATSTAAGSLAVLELRESLHVIGHHHGLALLVHRGADVFDTSPPRTRLRRRCSTSQRTRLWALELIPRLECLKQRSTEYPAGSCGVAATGP
mmetsp:Transcript_17425/g.53025  ORF Transcript_17425/g.53025 Transcript_17425/m.53025 type:complete len:138 (-) Transcript_17425:49-462(-)